MEGLKHKHLYSRSGNTFARSLFCKATLKDLPADKKKLFLFDSFLSCKKEAKAFSFGLGESVCIIENVCDLLRFQWSTNGIFVWSVWILDTSLRINHLQKTLSYTIKRTTSIAIRTLIEDLLKLWYRHSEHEHFEQSYHLVGSELKVRDGANRYQVSFFDDEVDDILMWEKSTELPQRVDTIQLYAKESPKVPETLLILDHNSPLLTDTFVITVDLDFVTEREKIRELAGDWTGFESWADSLSLDISPIQIDGLEELKSLLVEHGHETTIYTTHPKPLLNFLENNSIYSCVKEAPRVSLESFHYWTSLVLCDDILGKLFAVKRSKRQTMRSLDLLMTLRPWDTVVHQEHGVWIFREILEKEVAGFKREYVSIEYAGGDYLYVPITELYRITKYLGDDAPTLHKLWGNIWKKTLSDTEAEILQTAQELLDVYARRKVSTGYAFPKFPNEENTFRLDFNYTHTTDQHRAIEEVFEDMESPEPMDRLLCGDVGFGKTEVAMNATYKAVLAWKQVAIISPLVVLTLEHQESFKKRFAACNINVHCLSRLTTAKEEREVLKGLADGTVQIIIGTHRLLSDDIVFQKLWLLIIDEEHRFWVLDKERIKKLRANLDILSLSATPIPRSLNLALSGLRKFSILSTPPPNKKAISTTVIRYAESYIKQTILAELERGWQVIFLHNRVISLDSTGLLLQKIIGPKLKISLLSGQMHTDEIENTLLAFKTQKTNCLVSTTVIENGVNFLEANTILIDHADEFWLAQLHQLRGRVGRKDRDAHCILMYHKDFLADDSKKRLLAIVENSHLGAGFELAMRDLEIRGAGEILGIRQSWKVKETGVNLYLKLLESKVEELKSGSPSTVEVKIELDIEFIVNNDLFTSDIDKIQFYRSLEWMTDIEDLESAKLSFLSIHEPTEWLDRLFILLRARLLLAPYRVTSVKKVLKDYVFDFKWADTALIRKFLEIDKEGNFLVQNLERLRVAQWIYDGDFDFLTKLVYSLEHV